MAYPFWWVTQLVDQQETLKKCRSRIGTYLRGKYLIDDVIGIGGMGVVFAVTHRNRKRFAVKVLHPELAISDDTRKRFVREGYIANSVDHPGVVEVLDDDLDEAGSAFLVMELLEGASIAALCQSPGKPLLPKEALTVAHQLLEVLEAAHAKAIIHRDIKPANLFLTDDGQVKVLDFGIAHLREAATNDHATLTGTRLGTPAFMAPEQALGKTRELDAQTDLWAVGATLFTMLSGKLVHGSENAAQAVVSAATKPAPPLSSIAPDTPESLVTLVDKALSFDKTSRFESAAAMGEEVSRVHRELYGPLSNECLVALVERERENIQDIMTEPPSARVSSHTEAATGPSNEPAGSEPGEEAASEPPAIHKGVSRRGPLVVASLLVVAMLLGIVWWMHSATRQAQPGTVKVTATTDMLVPTDLDWLLWIVTTDNGKKTLREGTIALSDWKQIPVELTVITADQAAGPVTVQVVARRGGENGEVVLTHNARIQVPAEGTKTAMLRLDWLCSSGAHTLPCGLNETCRAGTCVDNELELVSAGPVSLAPEAKCFDMERCFASGMLVTVPVNDPAIGSCVLNQSHALMKGEKQNIALVVNTSASGNYGMCGPSGQCLVPLQYDSPTGWQLIRDKGKVIGIRLPNAVCRDIREGRVRGVAIAPAISGCSPESPMTPLCPGPDACIASDGICPPGLPDPWIGYTCSGSASPSMLRSDWLGCWVPSKGDEKRVKATGRWCCSSGEPPGNDPLLIDDMSGGPQLKLIPPKGYEGTVGGVWWTAGDVADVELSPPLNPGLFTYKTISPPVTTAKGRTFDRAACFSSPGFSGWIVLMGFNFLQRKGAVLPPYFDVSRYTGIRFWARSTMGNQEIVVKSADKNTFTEDSASTCNKNPKIGRCGDDWGIQSLVLSTQWKEYFIKWADFEQTPDDWNQARFKSFDTKHVPGAYFGVKGKGPDEKTPPFEFCISQIYFTQ